jgi:hypothetical protein
MSVSLRNLKGVRKRGKEGRGEREAKVDHALDTSSAGCGRFLFVTVIAGEIDSSLSRGEDALLVRVYRRLLNASWS